MTARNIISLAIVAALAAAGIITLAGHAGAQGARLNTLEDVVFSDLRDGRALVRVSWGLPLQAAPEERRQDNPPQLDYLFSQAAYSAKELVKYANAGPLRSFKAIAEADGKVRLTLYLKDTVTSATRMENNQFIVILTASGPSAGKDQQAPQKTQKEGAPARAAAPQAAPATAKPAALGKDIVSKLIMFKGDVQILYTAGVSQVAVGNSGIVSAAVLDTGGLLVIGENPGATIVHIWHADGSERSLEIHVTGESTDNLLSHMAALLTSIKGVTIRDLGELIVVEGDISPADKEQIEKIAKAFPALVNLTRVAAVPMEKMIHMAVQIVEFNTNAMEQLGVKWGSTIDGPGAAAIGDAVNNDVFRPGIPATTTIPPSLTLPTRVDPLRIYLGIATSITSKINLAVADGDAYVLASPTLSTRSGGEANFLAGGEVPLPSTSSTGQTNVEFKEYGIKLDIKPVADKENNILSKVGTEISSIDPSVAVNGIPGFLTRKTTAEVNVRHGETIVLSNLMSTESSRNFDKFPWLGDVPVLGWLFKSKNWREKRTELVIFVTPRIVDPSSDEVKRSLERGEQIRSNFKTMINDGIVY
ncbi:MAG: pilus assembly protein N-terminal domain-containing protein [Nitrospinae bacterium]|nr:pilus assembly protein N-terminal domain-containing protein [Nitrospinota bacterium]